MFVKTVKASTICNWREENHPQLLEPQGLLKWIVEPPYGKNIFMFLFMNVFFDEPWL